MKGIKEYINEARTGVTTLYFSSLASYFLFEYEISGQISDGKWENSRPYNHWKWVTNVECIVDGNHPQGYHGAYHPLEYKCGWLATYVNKYLKQNDKDYAWALRALNYGRAGQVLDKNKADSYKSYAFRSIIGDLPEDEITPDIFEKTLSDYQKKCWDEVKNVLNADFFKKFYATTYTVQDLKADLLDLEETINTKI